jgi:hypothetical protein
MSTIKPIFHLTEEPGVFRSAWGFHVGDAAGRHINHIALETFDEAVQRRDARELTRLIFAFQTESQGLDQAHHQVCLLAERIGGLP